MVMVVFRLGISFQKGKNQKFEMQHNLRYTNRFCDKQFIYSTLTIQHRNVGRSPLALLEMNQCGTGFGMPYNSTPGSDPHDQLMKSY